MRISLYNAYFASLGGGERRTALLAAHLARRHDVTLFVRDPVTPAEVRGAFDIDLSAVRIIATGEEEPASLISQARPDLFINNHHCSRLANPAPRGVYMCMFPTLEDIDTSSYDVVTANSAYTAGWIERRWGRKAEVVYSACWLVGRDATPKDRVILSVGRFFADDEWAHHKRQDVMVEAFRRLIDVGATGWELRLIGHVGATPRDQAFLDAVRARSAGYPIQVEPAASVETLRQAYRRASLYWHATGWGTDERTQPSKQEHLGMAILEAMSAGAVPMAFSAGGPREIITSGTDGVLWRDLDQLVARTGVLMGDPVARAAMGERAAEKSRRFGANHYLTRMDAIIDRLCSG